MTKRPRQWTGTQSPKRQRANQRVCPRDLGSNPNQDQVVPEPYGMSAGSSTASLDAFEQHVYTKAENLTFSKLYEEGDTYGLKSVIETVLNKWKTIPLNVAVIGSSGSGKSSLINAMRGVRNDHISAAPVGVVETAKTCTPYPHPTYSNFVMWDVPGVDTNKFPRKNYLEDIGFNKYGFFLICSSDRFTEEDSWLGDQVRKVAKPFYFLRTKIDLDLANAKRDNPGEFCEENTLKRIKDQYLEYLGPAGKSKLFLISSIYHGKWEYPDFEKKLLEDVSYEKRSALVLYLKAHSQAIIEEKKYFLKSRIQLVAMAATIGGTDRVRGVRAKIDGKLLKDEIDFYRDQLCLIKDALAIQTTNKGQRLADVRQLLCLKTVADMTTFLILEALKALKSNGDIQTVTRYVPLLRQVIKERASINLIETFLGEVLDDMCEDALKVRYYIDTSVQRLLNSKDADYDDHGVCEEKHKKKKKGKMLDVGTPSNRPKLTLDASEEDGSDLFNICVIGQPRSGKSLLIKAITSIVTSSEFKFKKVLIWECPGVTTKNFPENLGNSLRKCDLFLLCSCDRFTELDTWMVNELANIGKVCDLLVTKIDVPVENSKRDTPLTFDEKNILRQIRERYMQNVHENNKLFLISSLYPGKWEFPAFQQELVKEICRQKSEQNQQEQSALKNDTTHIVPCSSMKDPTE